MPYAIKQNRVQGLRTTRDQAAKARGGSNSFFWLRVQQNEAARTSTKESDVKQITCRPTQKPTQNNSTVSGHHLVVQDKKIQREPWRRG